MSTRPQIGFDLTDKSHALIQSVCRMLNGAVKYEEKSVEMYKNIHGQMYMADIDRTIIDELVGMIPDENSRRTKLVDIAKKVGCEIYYE